MADFLVPVRCLYSSINGSVGVYDAVNTPDADLIASVPRPLLKPVKYYFYSSNTKTINAIFRLQDSSDKDSAGKLNAREPLGLLGVYDDVIFRLKQENNLQKIRYVSEIVSTYTKLMVSIAGCFSNTGNKHLSNAVSGSYDNCHKTPSVEYWEQCNPVKIAAINIVINNLVDHGWNPKIRGISEYHSRAGTYRGGNEIIITCDFNE